MRDVKMFTVKKALLAAVVALPICLATGGAANAATELVIVSQGGAYTASQQKSIHDPYMAANPEVKIINDDSASQAIAKLRAMAATGKVTWDLVVSDISRAMLLGEDGLLETIPHDKLLRPAPDGTPPTEDLGAFIATPYFIPAIVFSDIFGYRTDVAAWGGRVPKTVRDVFDLQKFPGKRSLRRSPRTSLEWALLADGVAREDVYQVLSTEAGVNRAFAKLDTIKSRVIWWEKGAHPPQLLADGEVVIASAWNGRLFEVIEADKQPIATLWHSQIQNVSGWVLPKGAPHRDAVLKYLRFATDTQRQADITKYISYGPARKSSLALVGKHAELGIDMSPHMPTAPANARTALLVNYAFWAEYEDELTERFHAWLAQ